MWAQEWLHDDEYVPIPFEKKGVGMGRSKTGVRSSWTKKEYFELDLLDKLAKKMSLRKFKARFIHTPKEIGFFYETIKQKAIRPNETAEHSRNKLV